MHTHHIGRSSLKDNPRPGLQPLVNQRFFPKGDGAALPVLPCW